MSKDYNYIARNLIVCNLIGENIMNIYGFRATDIEKLL